MGRVILIEKPKAHIDVTKASPYGDIVVLFGDHDRRSSVFHTRAYAEEVLAQLVKIDFRPNDDAFCVTGAVVPIVVGLSAALLRYGPLKVLLYNASDDKYVLRMVGDEERTEHGRESKPEGATPGRAASGAGGACPTVRSSSDGADDVH